MISFAVLTLINILGSDLSFSGDANNTCSTSLWYGISSPPTGWSTGRTLLKNVVKATVTNGNRVECHLNTSATETTYNGHKLINDVYYWREYTGYKCAVTSDGKGWSCSK